MPLEAGAPVAQPGRAAQAVAVGVQPGQHIAPVIPMPSCRLVRGAIDKDGNPVDEWASFIGRFPELDRQQAQGVVSYDELVPPDHIAASIPRAMAVSDQVTPNEDPGEDAFGSRGGRSVRVSDLHR